MAVHGAKRVVAKFNSAPLAVREELRKALADTADQILADQKSLVPRDSGKLAAALTKESRENGMRWLIGLPSLDLARRHFWLRFLEYGTKGGIVSFRRAGSAIPHTMRVPPRARRPVLEPSMDANRDEFVARIRAAIRRGFAFR